MDTEYRQKPQKLRGGLLIEQSFYVQLLTKANSNFFSQTLYAENYIEAIQTAISTHITHPVIIEHTTKPIVAYVTSRTTTKEFFLKYDRDGNIAWQEPKNYIERHMSV